VLAPCTWRRITHPSPHAAKGIRLADQRTLRTSRSPEDASPRPGCRDRSSLRGDQSTSCPRFRPSHAERRTHHHPDGQGANCDVINGKFRQAPPLLGGLLCTRCTQAEIKTPRLALPRISSIRVHVRNGSETDLIEQVGPVPLPFGLPEPSRRPPHDGMGRVYPRRDAACNRHDLRHFGLAALDGSLKLPPKNRSMTSQFRAG
jgi:hypothetical protein